MYNKWNTNKMISHKSQKKFYNNILYQFFYIKYVHSLSSVIDLLMIFHLFTKNMFFLTMQFYRNNMQTMSKNIYLILYTIMISEMWNLVFYIVRLFIGYLKKHIYTRNIFIKKPNLNSQSQMILIHRVYIHKFTLLK